MVNALVAILCGLSLLAGWYYLTRSRYVEELNPFESPRRNRIRRQVRRVGAMTMMALSITFYFGFWLLMGGQASLLLVVVWILVFFLLFILFLNFIADIYLTARMRGRMKDQSGLDRNQHEDIDS